MVSPSANQRRFEPRLNPDELLTRIREVLNDTRMGTGLGDHRLERVDDRREVTGQFMLAVRFTVLTPMFHLRVRQVEDLEVGEETAHSTGGSWVTVLRLTQLFVPLVDDP